MPTHGTMKIDHLVPDVNRAGVRVLGYLQAETAIEGKHGFCILHRKSNMVEAPNVSSRLLCLCLESASRDSGSDYAHHEPAPGGDSLNRAPQSPRGPRSE